MKQNGEVRYIGITTSHGRRHREFAQIMEREPIDFVQLTYNLLDREAETRLLPLAREKGIAVIVNRPFQGGSLFRRFQSAPLPGWAGETGVSNWAEFFLKYIISHPAVTCVIPATTKVAHMKENMGALYGELPNPEQRQRMADYVRAL
jgi:aryl-alcohol dehydrogenase-like predicted oxidoreductase